MSLLMFVHEIDRIVVITDTLATDTDGAPLMFVTKCWPIPHMNTIAAVTGSGAVLERWVEFLRSRMIARDVVNLDLHTPGALRDIWRTVSEDYPEHEGTTSTVYHFGHDPEAGHMVRFVYRSASGFESERYDEPGIGMKPSLQGEEEPEGLVELAIAIRAEQAALPNADRIHIGGDLYATSIGEAGIGITRLHRFDDWADHWNAMCATAAAQDHAGSPVQGVDS